VSMKIGQKPIIKKAAAAVIGCALMAGLVTPAKAGTVTVTDVTDWHTAEVTYANIGFLHYNGQVCAGINTLSVNNGTSSTIYNGFCVDPFHWSAVGPTAHYSFVPLPDGPKAPAKLNTATARDIEDLWGEYYSPSMSSYNAAGLQIAIWELVSDNAVANDLLPAYDAFTVEGNDFGASQDLASLATYHGPTANLEILTGPGQDYVVDPVPDAGGTFLTLALTLGALILARSTMSKNPAQVAQAIRIHRSAPARSQRSARFRRCFAID
jgi:hypothetical protein